MTPSLLFFIRLLKTQAVMTRRFDSYLDGLGLNEFVILHHLSIARDQKLRRVDLAERVGLTASGVTRLLAPMEKIGLVGREVNERDARSSYVTLSSGGKRKLKEALGQAELFCDEHLSGVSPESLDAYLI
jgi:DNA-binding MarR family transcriptional regulator